MKLTTNEEKAVRAIRAASNKSEAAKEAYNAALKVVIKEAVIDVLRHTQLDFINSKPQRAKKK